MIRLIILSVFSFAMCNAFAQELTVTYKQTKNMGMEHVKYFTLYTTSSHSYYEETDAREVSAAPSEVTREANNMGTTSTTRTTVIGRKDMTPEFVYTSTDSDNIYFFQNFADRLLFVEDNYNLNWKITGETKKIGEFKATKATTTFRGREYVAWFYSGIPTQFGPWKFNNLPGLILEVHDLQYKLLIQAVKIERSKGEYQLNKILNDKEDALSIPEYIDKKNKILDEEFAKLASTLPKGIAPPKRSKDCKDCGNDIEIFN